MFFRRSFDPESYEKEFSTLASQITESQQYIERLRVLKSRVKRNLAMVLAAVYSIVLGGKFIMAPRGVGTNFVRRFVVSQSPLTLLVLFVLYPSVSVVLVRAIEWVFGVLIRSNQRYNAKLRSSQRKKVDELKRLTNYNLTNALLEKYEAEKPKEKPDKSVPTGQPGKSVQPGQNGQPGETGKSVPTGQGQIGANVPNTSRVSDKLFDILIGSANNESVENRYALICTRCHAHNGLAPPSCTDPADVCFLCMRCGARNGKEKREDTPKKEKKRKPRKEKIDGDVKMNK